jgi:RimJ/RimL family protein N-acetyltransferase
MAEAPVLTTARLILRPFRAGDLDAQAATLADPEVVRHLGGTPMSREETWRKMLTAPGMWAWFGFGYWAVERREDGAWLGQVGFGDFKRDMQPSIEGLPEMGWIFTPGAQGQGYCSEAVATGLAWADRVLRAPEIVAIIDPANTPSIRVAAKSGFSGRSEALYRDEPILLFRRCADAVRLSVGG